MGNEASAQSHLLGEQGPAASPSLAARICGEGQGDVTVMGQLLQRWLGAWPARVHWQSVAWPEGRASPHILAALRSPVPARHPPCTAPSPSWEEARLLRQSRDSGSWCFRKHVRISVWLKVSRASRDTSWEIPGFPAAQVLCV